MRHLRPNLMDADAEKKVLTDERDFIQSYLDHPLTEELETTCKEAEESLTGLICDQPIVNIETFFAHFESVGHLRGLRRSRAFMRSKLEDVKQRIKELD